MDKFKSGRVLWQIVRVCGGATVCALTRHRILAAIVVVVPDAPGSQTAATTVASEIAESVGSPSE